MTDIVHPDDHPLRTRAGLPDALRVLVREAPREGWEGDPRFNDLLRFWLDRHQGFRHALTLLGRDAEAVVDRRSEPLAYAAALSQLGGRFVAELHGHHQIEDVHYFPVLAARDPRISRGFDILDRDHHALDAEIAQFVAAANGVLRAVENPVDLVDRAGRFRDDLSRFDRFLDRHLVDEEELVVPVILKYGMDGLG